MPDDYANSPLSADDREASFPTHIELGKSPEKTVGDGPMIGSPAVSKGKKTPAKYYPTLYLSGIDGLDQIPSSGCALIEFKRVAVNKSERDGQDPQHSVELEIHTICLPPAGGDVTAEDDMGDGMKKTAKKMGVDLGPEEAGEDPAEEAAETPDEEKAEGDEET